MTVFSSIEYTKISAEANDSIYNRKLYFVDINIFIIFELCSFSCFTHSLHIKVKKVKTNLTAVINYLSLYCVGTFHIHVMDFNWSYVKSYIIDFF